MMSRDVVTPMVLLVILLIGQQCSGMKIIQGFAVEIFADVFTEVTKQNQNTSKSPKNTM